MDITSASAQFVSALYCLCMGENYTYKGGFSLIMLGFMLYIIGMLVLIGSSIIFAYVIADIAQAELYNISPMSVVIPGILLLLFLIVSIISVTKLLQHKRWKEYYIGSMVFYFIGLAFYYTHIPEPLQDLIIFVNICFITTTLLFFLGFKRKEKTLQMKAKEESI